mgnify:CR=1 FL=1
MTKKKVRVSEIFLYGLIFLCSLVAVLFLVYIKSKKIGAGDIKLLSLIFFCYPLYVSVMVCFISILLSIVVLLIKHKKKSGIPLAPFVFIGNCVVTIYFISILSA